MRVRHVVVASLACATIACGVLLGIDDRSFDPELDVPGRADAGADTAVAPETAAPVDAGVDAPACAKVCTNGCDGGICEIDCPATGATCTFPVKCPAGLPCRVRCIGQKACDAKGNIDCSAATSCIVVCRGGQDACDNMDIKAGATPICVKCEADGVCGSDLKCTTTAQCRKQCSGGSCAAGCGNCTQANCP